MSTQTATILVASLALGVSCLSLGWQVAAFALSGARIRVDFSMSHVYMTGPGASQDVAMTFVSNHGRAAVEIISVLYAMKGVKAYGFVTAVHPGSAPIPAVVEPGRRVGIIVPREPLLTFVAEHGGRGQLRAVVYLANGKRRRSGFVSVGE